jgi:hypothetical protein
MPLRTPSAAGPAGAEAPCLEALDEQRHRAVDHVGDVSASLRVAEQAARPLELVHERLAGRELHAVAPQPERRDPRAVPSGGLGRRGLDGGRERRG